MRSCGTSGLTATTANLTLAIPAFDTSFPSSLLTYQPHQGLASHCPCPQCPPCPGSLAGWQQGGGVGCCWWRVAASGASCAALCPGFTGWEAATPPHTSLRGCHSQSSQRREGRRPPTGVSTPTHHHPTQIKPTITQSNPNPPSPNSTRTNHHPSKANPNTTKSNSTPPPPNSTQTQTTTT